jgi:hypothetical protein
MIEVIASRLKLLFMLILFSLPVLVSIWDSRLSAWLSHNQRLEAPEQPPIVVAQLGDQIAVP